MLKLPPIINHCYIVLTEGCNLNCDYCYYKSHKIMNEIPMEYIDKVLNSFTCTNKPRIIFFGGEPTLKQDLIKNVVDKYGDKFHYQIVTNGTYHFHEFLKNIWKPIKDNFDIQVSWDGNNITRPSGNGNITNETVYNIILKELQNGAEFEGRCVLNEKSVNTFFDTYCTFKNLHKKYHFSGDFTIAHQPSFEQSFHIAFSEQLKMIYNDIKQELNKNEKLYIPRFLSKTMVNIIENKPIISCDIGTHIVIKPNGDIYPCTILSQQDERFKLGNINDDIDTEIICDLRLGSSCQKDCKYKSVCDGGCRYERIINFPNDWKCNICSHTCDIYKALYDSTNMFFKSLTTKEQEKLYIYLHDYNLWSIDYIS